VHSGIKWAVSGHDVDPADIHSGIFILLLIPQNLVYKQPPEEMSVWAPITPNAWVWRRRRSCVCVCVCVRVFIRISRCLSFLADMCRHASAVSCLCGSESPFFEEPVLWKYCWCSTPRGNYFSGLSTPHWSIHSLGRLPRRSAIAGTGRSAWPQRSCSLHSFLARMERQLGKRERIMCLCNCVTLFIWSHDVYSSVHPGEGSSSVALLKGASLFSPCERVFSIC